MTPILAEMIAAPVGPPPRYTRHGTSYLARPLSELSGVIRDARRLLTGTDFDTFVGRGLSGAMVVPSLAEEFGLRFLVVRKGESCHSSSRAEGHIGRRWVFVDDLISSGETLRQCKQTVVALRPDSQYVGAFLYGVGGLDGATWHPPREEVRSDGSPF